MARIFINYRRDDTQGVAGRLFDHLALKYSRSELFMDLDAMKPGLDFIKQLDSQVSQCHVLLAMIGSHWLDTRDASGASGTRRSDAQYRSARIELPQLRTHRRQSDAVSGRLQGGQSMPRLDLRSSRSTRSFCALLAEEHHTAVDGKFLLRLRHRAKRREVIGAGDATLRFAKRVSPPSQSVRHGLAASARCR